METALIISVVSLSISGITLLIYVFTFLKDYILPATVGIFVGDSLQIVRDDRNKVHFNFNLTNPRNKLSVINKLKGVLISPNGNEHQYEWNIFYELKAHTAMFSQLPTSIAVLAKSSVFQGVEFIVADRFTWVEGKYQFKIQGWCNRGMHQNPNISRQVIFSLSQDDVNYLQDLPVATGEPISMRPVRIRN